MSYEQCKLCGRFLNDENLFDSPVRVTNSEGEIKFFNCTAAFDITYYAKEVEEKLKE